MRAEKDNFSILRMARVLKVSASGYHSWHRRRLDGPGPRAVARRERDKRVATVFDESKQTYGAPRVAAQLAREGSPANPKTVADSMRRQGIEGISPRMFRPITTIPGNNTHHLPDLVSRRWDTGRLDAVWITDITYLRTGKAGCTCVRSGTAALGVCWAGRWIRCRTPTWWNGRCAWPTRSVASCLQTSCSMLIAARNSPRHSYGKLQRNWGSCNLSGERAGAGIAMQESFWSTLKTEFYDRRTWLTRAEAKTAVACWIEEFYNRKRLHSKLGMVPPVEHELSLRAQKEPAAMKEEALTQAA